MPARIEWTDALDTRLRQMRAEGASWEAIGDALGMAYATARDRGYRIGATAPPVDYVVRPEDPNRLPLRAGHPDTWRLLTAGTLLEGTPYG